MNKALKIYKAGRQKANFLPQSTQLSNKREAFFLTYDMPKGERRQTLQVK
jgi:hypothetical protein